jgi:hypothetical protein
MGFLRPSTVFVILLAMTVQKPPIQFSVPPPADWIHIDGSKNPELIPEWSVWDTAFRVFHSVGDLPTAVLNAATKEEAAAIQDAATEHGRITAECEERGLKLIPLLGKETPRVINEKTQALNLDCRTRTLALVDRLLERLRPDARAALNQWVESQKKGMRASVPKRELEFYLRPK